MEKSTQVLPLIHTTLGILQGCYELNLITIWIEQVSIFNINNRGFLKWDILTMFPIFYKTQEIFHPFNFLKMAFTLKHQ